MHGEVEGFAERIRNGLVFRSDCSTRRNRPRTKSIPVDVNDINMSAMEALERQSDNLIAALKPDDESISLRRSVFLFVEKIITDCFSDVPVRTPAAFSGRVFLPVFAGVLPSHTVQFGCGCRYGLQQADNCTRYMTHS